MNGQNNNPYGNSPYATPNMMPNQQGQPVQPMYPQQPPQQFNQPNFGQGMQVPPQAPMQVQQPMLQQMPNYARPDEQAMMAAYQQHRESNGGNGFNFVKFLGPNGEDKWATVPVNYTAMLRLYILPPWVSGKNIFSISKSHFWKSGSKPQGTSIACPGPDTCTVCQAKVQALDSGNAALQKKAKDFGRVRTQFMYQVAMLDFIEYHANNGWVPYILPAGSNLHSDIGNLIEDKGISIFDPQQGRPLRVKKTKIGPQTMDIEYKCSDEDPSPLPQVLWPLLNNLIDLDQLNKMPTEQEMMAAVQDMGLVFSQYGGPNPYAVQTPQTQAQVQNPYSPPAMPPVMPPVAHNPNPPMPNMVPNMQPQQPVGPPPMSPPPVTSNGGGQGYAAQPSQQQAPQQTQQEQSTQQPEQGFVRQPIQETQNTQQQQAEQPKTLEQLQANIRGNNG